MRSLHKNSISQRGFSLVELMVAAVIGLIGTIIIFQVFAVFEGQKRATTSGGDAQSNLALALHTIERDARQAGAGINDPTFFGCDISAVEEIPAGTGAGTAFTLPFVPARITQGATASDPDSLTFFYGSSQLAHFPPTLVQNLASAADPYRVSNRHGFQVGDVLIVAGLAPGPVCILSQVRDLPTAVANSNTIEHNNGTYDLNGATTATRYNKSGGLGPNFVFGTTRVFNLGRSPVVNSYSLNNGQLLLQPFRGAAAPIMDGIVQMQARYGKDTGIDNIVDVYEDTPGDWSKVLSIRIALAARVSQYEKEEVSPAVISMWPGGPDWTLTAEERHYRYRIIDTIVPLRNMIWRRAS